jgi:hypothetical protein
MSQLIQVGRLGAGMMALVACASMAGADKHGALEIAHGIRLTPPAGWQERDRTRNSVELVKTAPADANTILVRTSITTESRTTPEEAVQRLGEIANEQPQSPPVLTTIGGWPAIERRVTTSLPRTGGDDRGHTPAAPPETVVTSTVAIAAGATIVRFDTTLGSGADPRLLDEFLDRVRKLDLDTRGDPRQAQRALDVVRQAIRKRLEAPPPPPPAPTAPSGR